jgi:hypothetical protein
LHCGSIRGDQKLFNGAGLGDDLFGPLRPRGRLDDAVLQKQRKRKQYE